MIVLMQSVMPQNSSCIRIGGDEFIFFLPNISKEQGIKYENEMHEILYKSSKQINNTNVTSYCLSHDESNSLSSLIDIADSAINLKKQTAKSNTVNQNIDNWDILQNKISENFTTFFKTLRFHKFPMQPTHMQNILLSVINSYDSFIEEQNNSSNDSIQEVKNENISESFNKPYDTSYLQNLNNLFMQHKGIIPESEQLESFDTSTFANILNGLVRAPLTMNFNKSYLIEYLLNDKNKTFNVLRLSSAFVKVSNTINDSHSTTDIQIKEKENSVYKFLISQLDFNQDAFSDSPLNYMISLDGGDMLLALDLKSNFKVDAVKDFLSNQHSYYKNNDLLRLVCADSLKKMNKSNFDKVLNKQEIECNKNKIPFIHELLDDNIVNDLLNITLRDTMHFYDQLVPNINDISAKTKYLNLVSKTVLDLYSSLDVVHDKPKPHLLTRLTSLFKKDYIALPPSSSIEQKAEDTVPNNKKGFVEKYDIDYSKIDYNSKTNGKNENDLSK